MISRRTHNLFSWIDKRFVLIAGLWIVGAIALATIGTSVKDSDEPSYDPEGEIYDISYRADDVFESSSTIRPATFLVDTEHGTDVLTREGLLPVAHQTRLATATPANAAHLVEVFDRNLGLTIEGITSIADAVDQALPDGLAGATDDDVKVALAKVLAADSPTGALRFTLAQSATAEPGVIDGRPITIWRAPAYQVEVRYDLTTFDAVDDDARDRAGERWLRELQDDLRNDDLRNDDASVRLIGVGIDPLLTGEEQFAAGGPFIFLAVGLIVILVGLLLRSYWATAVVASALGATLLASTASSGWLGSR